MIYKVIVDKQEKIFYSTADKDMVTYLFNIYDLDSIEFYFKGAGYEYREFRQPETLALRKKMNFKPKINFTIEL